MLDNSAIDPSQRILMVAGFVLGMFSVYFGLTVLSNRSVRRLADTLERRRRQAFVRLGSGRLPRFAVPLLVAAAAGLIALLVLCARFVE